MKSIFLSLVCLLSLSLLGQEKLVFKSYAGQPEAQTSSQQAVNQRLSALLPELWRQEGLAFGDSIALRLRFDYDGLLQYRDFYGQSLSALPAVFRAEIATWSELIADPQREQILSFKWTLPQELKRLPNLSSISSVPSLSACQDFNEEGQKGCFRYLCETIAEDFRREMDSAEVQALFSLELYFEKGLLRGLDFSDPPSDASLAAEFREYFLRYYQELMGTEAMSAEAFSYALHINNFAPEEVAPALRQKLMQRFAYQNLAHWTQEAYILSTRYLNPAKDKINRYYFDLLQQQGLSERAQIPFGQRMLSVDSLSALAQSQKEKPEENNTEPGKVLNFAAVETIPVFPGCAKDLSNEEQKICFQRGILTHVAKNFEFPEEARQRGIMGKVYVNFVIERAGHIGAIKIVRGVHPLLDFEAIRVVSEIPRLKAARVKGEAVRMSFTLPINALLK